MSFAINHIRLVRHMQARELKSLPVFCLLAFFAALVPTLVVLLAVQFSLQQLGLDMTVWNRGPFTDGEPKSLGWILGSIVVAPVAETFMIAFLIGLENRCAIPKRMQALVAALAIAGLHGWYGGMFWFVGVFWSFVVFSYGFVRWRPISFRHAFAAAAIPHALVNLTAGMVESLDKMA